MMEYAELTRFEHLDRWWQVGRELSTKRWWVIDDQRNLTGPYSTKEEADEWVLEIKP